MPMSMGGAPSDPVMRELLRADGSHMHPSPDKLQSLCLYPGGFSDVDYYCTTVPVVRLLLLTEFS